MVIEAGSKDGESWASSGASRKAMLANRRRDTAPEWRLRRAAHAIGLRYRVDSRPVPAIRRTADLVFAGARVAVFVDGCYWHGCSDHFRLPLANREYWETKIRRNAARDRETDQLLAEAGWRVVRVWEHEDVATALGKVVVALRGD